MFISLSVVLLAVGFIWLTVLFAVGWILLFCWVCLLVVSLIVCGVCACVGFVVYFFVLGLGFLFCLVCFVICGFHGWLVGGVRFSFWVCYVFGRPFCMLLFVVGLVV